MIISNELASITILHPYMNGDQLVNEIVPFKVFAEGNLFKAIPLVDDAKRKMLSLPPQYLFEFFNHTIIPDKTLADDDLEIVKNIVRELQMQTAR